MKKFKDLKLEFDNKRKIEQNSIRNEPNRLKRLWKRVWFLFTFPWKWAWVNLRDWRSVIIFLGVIVVVSSEVWVPYLIYWLTGNTWFLGIGSACWLFWLGPGTPFIVLCVAITVGIKAALNAITTKKRK